MRDHVQLGCFRLQQARHILNTKDVYAFRDELIDKVHVVLQSVLRVRRASNVPAVADNGFADTSSLLGSINTKFHL